MRPIASPQRNPKFFYYMNNPNPAGQKLQFETTRFGEIEIADGDVIAMPEGLVGFNTFRRWTLLKDPEQEPFLWLQSLDDGDLAFVVVNPFIFFPGYDIKVKQSELAPLQLDDITKAEVLTIVTIPSNPMDLTANLRGPLLFNVEAKLAKQLVLIDDRYNTRHFLLHDVPPDLAAPRDGGDGNGQAAKEPDSSSDEDDN
ncbi:MAG: flagellar assembly protein FliW [bacterium]|nr:flagellar assembly protein FliW [bacterium]